MGNLIGPPKASYFFNLCLSLVAAPVQLLGVDGAMPAWGRPTSRLRLEPSLRPGEAALDLPRRRASEPQLAPPRQIECE
jgi:hypothetical protein